MSSSLKVFLFLAMALLAGDSRSRAAVVSYPVPSCYGVSDQLTVAADGTSIPVIANGAVYDYCSFSFSGEATVTVTAHQAIGSYSISPESRAIPATAKGNTLSFTLKRSAYLIVKIDGLRELVIAADDLERDVPPSSGKGIYNVAQPPYSADGTGEKLATAPLQTAIDDANRAGGGTVYVPPGVYTCASLVLRSDVTLYLAGGAVLRASGDPAYYTTRYRKNSVKMDGTWFIYTAPDSKSIALRGRGTIDGNGMYLREARHYLINLLVPLQCSDFTVDGVTFRDSGLWGVIPTRSDHVVIRNTKHFNENDRNYEDDAIDVQECQDVMVTHTVAVSEDDTYSTKTWETGTDIAVNWPGQPEPLSHVTFDDCLAWSRCATFKVGFGVFQPQSDITFRNSCSYKSMRAVGINHQYGPSPARNITVDNIEVEGFWPRKGSASRWLEITDSGGGPLESVIVKNCVVRALGSAPAVLRGKSAESKVRGVTFRNNVVNGTLADSLAALNITGPTPFVEDISVRNGD